MVRQLFRLAISSSSVPGRSFRSSRRQMWVSSKEGFSIRARRIFSFADKSSAEMDSGAAVRASSGPGFSSGAMRTGLDRRFGKAGGDTRRSDRGGNLKLRNFRAQCAANHDGIQQRVEHLAVTEYTAAFHQRKS